MGKAATKKTGQGRRGMEVPADYLKLITTGILLPDPADEHSMKCARCWLPVILIWNHEPVKDKEARSEKVLPAGVWGEDVTVLCMCCSYPECNHKTGGAEEPASKPT